MPPFVSSDFVDGHDVRMIQMGRGGGFRAKAGDFGFVRQFAGADELESDDSIEANLSRFEAINKSYSSCEPTTIFSYSLAAPEVTLCINGSSKCLQTIP